MKYLLNTTNTIYLFRGGYLELLPNIPKEVTDEELNSSMFSAAISAGHIKVYDSLTTIPKTAVTSESIPLTTYKSGESLSIDQMKDHYKKIADNKVKELKKYENEAVPLTPTNLDSVVTEETATEDKEPEKTNRRKTSKN